MDPDDTIIDLAEHRASLSGEAFIPDHVREEMEAAAQLWHELLSERKDLRFDVPERRVTPLLEAIVPREDGPGAVA
jgi:hypothetical protein